MENRLFYWLETILPRPPVRKTRIVQAGLAITPRVRAFKIYWLNEPVFVFLGYLLLILLTRHTDGSLFQVLLAASLALFGLGFSILAAIAPQPGYFGIGERIALSSYMSISVGGLLGFALSRSSWGLQIDALLVSALLLNLVCYLVVVYRRRKLESVQVVNGPALNGLLFSVSNWWRGQSPLSLGITFMLFVFLVGGGMAFSANLLAPAIDPPMTEFFLLNEDQQIQEFPEQLPLGERFSLTYGIINLEASPSIYEVQASARGKSLGRSMQVYLEPGQTFDGRIDFEIPHDMAVPGERIRVDFDLFEGDKVYRSLHLWFEVQQVGEMET
jgi:uncharacterized membrane protein